jgi:trimethylamine--corrinoid protein Co-methyltransferase
MDVSPSRRKRQQPALPSGISQPIVAGLPKLSYLSAGQVEQIHAASLAILARTGVIFKSAAAIDYFQRAGAHVAGERVYLDGDLIAHCLSTAPSEYTLHARNPANTLVIGGDNCVVMPGGGPPYTRDLDGARRPGTLADVENFARLSALSPNVHVVARKAVEAQDIPVAVRHLECWRAVLTLADKPATSGFVNGRPEAEDALQMLAIVFGGEAAIDGMPVAHCNINVNSPLLYDTMMLEGLLAFAGYGQPVIITPFVMAGVTGPATLAGALAQHNAEVLAGVALTQLVRPGTPAIYGTATSNVDMRNAAPAIGSPESAVSTAVCAQLARHYRLPCRGGGALTDSHLPDAQSNYERMMTLIIAALSGVNFMMHGLGVIESYLTLCYEQFVIDTELIAMIRHLVSPLEISPETLALDTIHEIGPGGFFLATPHTMRHYRQAHFLPEISLRNTYDQWVAEGSHDTAQRANMRCRTLLASYVPPPMAPGVEDRLYAFVERRKRELLV